MTDLQQYIVSLPYLEYVEQYAETIATECSLPTCVAKIIAEYCLQAQASDPRFKSAAFTQWLTSEQMLRKFLLCVGPTFLTSFTNFNNFTHSENIASSLWVQYLEAWKGQKTILYYRTMLVATQPPKLDFCRLKEADEDADKLWYQFVEIHGKEIYLYFIRMMSEDIEDYFYFAGKYIYSNAPAWIH